MQTIKIISAILATILGTYAFFPYIRDILKNKTKPHLYTWLIWTIGQTVAVAGLWYGDGGIGAIELTVGTFFVFIIFLLSFKYGTKNIKWTDKAFLLASLVAIAIWVGLDNAFLSIAFICLIDFLGFIPSFRKSWYEPWSETTSSWALFSIGNIFAIIALKEYNFLTVGYLITITINNLALLIVCLIRRRKISKPKS